jgi:CheY-like chemotaxis protein
MAGPEASAHRVLLVEDDEMSATFAAVVLRHLGCEVTCVADGESAVMAASTKEFDLILMDYQMPTISGLQAASEIRRIEQSRNRRPVPIVGLTGHREEKEHQAGRDAGMNDVLTKPIYIEELRAAVDRWTCRG